MSHNPIKFQISYNQTPQYSPKSSLRSLHCPTPTFLYNDVLTLTVENGYCGFIHQLCSEVDLPHIRRSILTLNHLIQRHLLNPQLNRIRLLRPKVPRQFVLLLKSEQILDALYFRGIETLNIGTISCEETGDVRIVDDQHMRYLEYHQQLCQHLLQMLPLL